MTTTCRYIAALLIALPLLITGCATHQQADGYDYTAFLAARPASILVLPPVNNTPDVAATNSMWSHATVPLAESGYYVFPVTLVQETFRQNGMTVPEDIHRVPPARLRQIFGADAALYITVTDYGSTYIVIDSQTRVSATAKLVDLHSGRTLWTGSASASSKEGNNTSSGSLIGMLIIAAVTQVADTVSDKGYAVAGIASDRLLSASSADGSLLVGPHAPNYDGAMKKRQSDADKQKKKKQEKK